MLQQSLAIQMIPQFLRGEEGQKGHPQFHLKNKV